MSTDTRTQEADDEQDDGVYSWLADHYEGELIGDVCEILAHSESSNREANS